MAKKLAAALFRCEHFMALPIRIRRAFLLSYRPSPSDILQRICLAKFERPPRPLFVESAVFIFAVRGRPFRPPPLATTSNPGLMDYAKLRSSRGAGHRHHRAKGAPSIHPSPAFFNQRWLKLQSSRNCVVTQVKTNKPAWNAQLPPPLSERGLAPVMQTL